jgi:hypothetical protein
MRRIHRYDEAVSLECAWAFYSENLVLILMMILVLMHNAAIIKYGAKPQNFISFS